MKWPKKQIVGVQKLFDKLFAPSFAPSFSSKLFIEAFCKLFASFLDLLGRDEKGAKKVDVFHGNMLLPLTRLTADPLRAGEGPEAGVANEAPGFRDVL